jgi:hypothetical protein
MVSLKVQHTVIITYVALACDHECSGRGGVSVGAGVCACVGGDVSVSVRVSKSVSVCGCGSVGVIMRV